MPKKAKYHKSKIEKNDFYNSAMIDIETRGTGVRAIIVSIGAVLFRITGRDSNYTLDEDTTRSFYAVLDKGQQQKKGRTSDRATMRWWKKQSAQAQEVLDAPGRPVEDVLDDLDSFLGETSRMWSNSPQFDQAKLEDLYNDFERGPIWEWWMAKDVRTLREIWNQVCGFLNEGRPPRLRNTTEHNALEDAKEQVLQVQTMYADIRGSKYGDEKRSE